MADIASDPNANPVWEKDPEGTSNKPMETTKGRQPLPPPRDDVLLQRSIALTYPLTAVKWYRSTLYNALILGVCNFLAPGIWGGKTIQCPGERKQRMTLRCTTG